MDFKTLVNKESFKTILLHQLKSQVKTKYGPSVSTKIQESLEKEDTASTNHIVSSISNVILESDSFSEFVNSFLESVENLLEDKETYVAKQEKIGNSSQCSSASSVNGSSIDFLSPDQFQNVAQSLGTGTNAEKLEALGTLYRLPTLEHLTHHFLWAEVEKGLHNALSSPIIFLKAQSLRLYIKMLTSPEPKVVLESYQSLIKYFLQVLLPTLNQTELDRCRCAVEIISILNKFLRSISTHWLRYPQVMIESITTQSLEILSTSCKMENGFPVWMCVALCDPEAQWLKSVLHGHVSRASLLNALRENLDILYYVVDMCDGFCSEDERFIVDACCQKSYLVAEITHSVCFLGHLLGYCEGRHIFDLMADGGVSFSWINVLRRVMNCVIKLCDSSCFTCCMAACDILSRKWLYFWCSESTLETNDILVETLVSNLDKEDVNLNMLYFSLSCFGKSYCGISNVECSLESQLSINDFLIKCVKQCLALSVDNEETCCSVIYVFNSSLDLMKVVFSTPSSLFMNYDFIKILSQWLLKVKEFSNIKSLTFDFFQKKKVNIISVMDHNISKISISFLNKPVRSMLCPDVSVYEASLNILLEKILKDIKSGNSVCSVDISILSSSLNRSLGAHFILSRAFIFRLSSIIWQLRDKANGMEDFKSLKLVLDTLLISLFCDLPLLETFDETNTNPEYYLFQHVLLLPITATEYIEQEDYSILALQIISLLCTSIHSLCLLESEFKLSELLLARQSQYLMIEDKQVIDPVSVLQNHILVKSYTVGGSGERILPCDMLESNDDGYNWPFVMEFPLPEVFFRTDIERIDVDLSIDELQNEDLKSTFLSFVQSNKNLSPNLIYKFLEKSISSLQSDINFLQITECVDLDASDYTLHKTELTGIEIVKRYGIQLNLTSHTDDKDLERLLKASKSLLKNTDSNRLDMFISSVYLMCKADIDTAWSFLQEFTKCNASLFVWREYQAHVSDNCLDSSIPLQSVICELCDLIVKQSLPRLFSALQFHGILPSVIFSYWNLQCYWNYLDFVEISHFVLLNVLFSGEFTLYFFVAVLKHLHNFILENSHKSELFSLLLKNPIEGFKVCEYLDFMMELSNTFHLTISKHLTITLNNDNV